MSAELLQQLAAVSESKDYQPLDDPQFGYTFIADPNQKSMWLIMNQTSLKQRRQEYGHDLQKITADILTEAQSAGYITAVEDWKEIEIPEYMKWLQDGIMYGKIRPAVVLPITSHTPDQLAMVKAQMAHEYETATVTSMLPTFEQWGGDLGENETHTIHLFGFTTELCVENGSPYVIAAFDLKRALTQSIFGVTGPFDRMKKLIKRQFVLSEEEVDDSSHTKSSCLPVIYDPEDQDTEVSLNEKSELSLFVFKLWLQGDVREPLQRLNNITMSLRSALIDQNDADFALLFMSKGDIFSRLYTRVYSSLQIEQLYKLTEIIQEAENQKKAGKPDAALTSQERYIIVEQHLANYSASASGQENA